MQSDPPPRVSVLIVCWNSATYLPHCLDSLSKQTFNDFEVVIIDNGSTDGGMDGLVERFPNLLLRVESLAANCGFAAGNNIAAQLARGEWLALLNSDAFPEPDWLEQLMLAADRLPAHSFFTSRQFQGDDPNYLDGEGDTYHVSGMVWRRNYGLPVYPAGETEEVFSACGAAAMFRRCEFLDAGGFDESYFAYLEDIDLGFRLRLEGARCYYVPQAAVHHVGSAATGKRSDFAVYHGYRNMIWTFLKDMPASLFWLYLPLHVATVLLFFGVYISRGQAWTALLALSDALTGVPRILSERRNVQGRRVANAKELCAVMSTGLLRPYQESLRRKKRYER